MAQKIIRTEPLNGLVSGYNNSTPNNTIAIGSKIKISTPFTAVVGSNTVVTGNGQKSVLSVGSGNSSHTSSGAILGSNTLLLRSNNVLSIGDGNTLSGNNIIVNGIGCTVSANNVFVIGNYISVTNSNSTVIDGDLFVTGNVSANNVVGATGATGPQGEQGATGPSGISLYSYSPTSSQDAYGSIGDLAYDTSFLFVKTSQGWLRAGLSTF